MNMEWQSYLNNAAPHKHPFIAPKQTQLIDLSSYGTIICEGEECLPFLQGQVTQQLKKIAMGGTTTSAICHKNGKVRAIAFITQVNGQWFIHVPQNLISELGKYLRNLGKLSKVSVTNGSDEYAQFAIIGPKANTILQSVDIHLNEPGDVIHDSQTSYCKLWGLEETYLVFSEVMDSLKHCYKHTVNAAQVCDINVWQAHLISQNMPYIDEENHDKHLPHPLNLDKLNLISLDKGCYLGQEIIARTEYRGAVKKHLVRFKCESNTAPHINDKLYHDNKAIGDIVSVAKISDKHYEMLAITQDEHVSDASITIDETSIKLSAL